MSDLTSPTPSAASPFDAIKRTRPDGTEYWSARDLMPLLGYPAWREFRAAIERAMAAAEAQGHPVDGNFGVNPKKAGQRGPAREDFDLTRFAAYLVAMNGDPRKPEVAAAQAYFAIRTREAETTQPDRELDEIEVAERYLTALREKRALAAQVEAQRPLVAQAETFRQADGLRTIPDLANDLKVHAATNYPGTKVLQADVFDLAARVGLIVRGNTVRHNQPTARAIEAGWVLPKETAVETKHHGTVVKIGTRLTPRGYGRLWDAAVTNLRTHGCVLPALKEIA